MKKKRVAIVTGWYFPLNTPRAFRATELSIELAKRGYLVDVFSASQAFDSSKLSDYKNLNVNYLGVWNVSDAAKVNGSKKSFFREAVKNILDYFFSIRNLISYKKMQRSLQFESTYDVVISIGLPFFVHWALGLKIKKDKLKIISIADYGDPFSCNPGKRVAFYFRYLEKRILESFTYIVVPTNNSLSSFKKIVENRKLKVIPQGFDLEKVILPVYSKNSVPTFAFAGIFYKKIRNPRILFEYLSGLKNIDFKFILYTNNSIENRECFEEFIEILGSKLEIREMIDRGNLLQELAKMDFLINQNNLFKEQTPSKLIDYAIVNRPVFSFNQNELDENLLSKYIECDFEGYKSLIDLEKYNIKSVTDSFESLFC